MDRLPTDLSSTILSAATSLEIPLSSVVLSVSPNVNFIASYAKLPVSIAYMLDPTGDYCLCAKAPQEISNSPNLAKTFLRLVRRNHIQFAPFFVRTFIHRRFACLGRFPFLTVADHCISDVSPFVEAILIITTYISCSPASSFHQVLSKALLAAIQTSSSIAPPVQPVHPSFLVYSLIFTPVAFVSQCVVPLSSS